MNEKKLVDIIILSAISVKIILIILITVIIIIGAYEVGHISGESKAQSGHKEFIEQLLENESFFLNEFLGDKTAPELKSGAYEFTLIFPGARPLREEYHIKFERDKATCTPIKKRQNHEVAKTIQIKGSTARWYNLGKLISFDDHEIISYVGVICSEGIWGHVYKKGEKNKAIGLWEIVPKK